MSCWALRQQVDLGLSLSPTPLSPTPVKHNTEISALRLLNPAASDRRHHSTNVKYLIWTVHWCIHPGRSRCSSYCPTDSWQCSGQTDASFFSFFFSLDWVLGGCHINTPNPLSVPLSPSVEWSVLIMYITVPNKGYFLPAEDTEAGRESEGRVQGSKFSSRLNVLSVPAKPLCKCFVFSELSRKKTLSCTRTGVKKKNGKKKI